MKRLIVVVLAAALSGCVSAEALRVNAFGGKGGPKVNQEAVQSWIADGKEDQARLYLTRLGLSEAEVMVTLQMAKKANDAAVAAKAAQPPRSN